MKSTKTRLGVFVAAAIGVSVAAMVPSAEAQTSRELVANHGGKRVDVAAVSSPGRAKVERWDCADGSANRRLGLVFVGSIKGNDGKAIECLNLGVKPVAPQQLSPCWPS